MDGNVYRIRPAMAIFICTILSFQLSPASSKYPGEEDENLSPAIGTAISIKRDVKEGHRFLDAHRLTHAIEIGKDGRIKTTPEQLIREKWPFGRKDVILGIPRSLKYAGACSENTNHIEAIVECSNAVRQDPDFFAKDYPCGYNQWRGEVVSKKLPTLRTGPTIQRLAQLHTDDQARMNSMSHTGSDGSNLQTRADRIKLPWGAVGENVAVGFSSAKAVVMAWMCSPAHRKNLMSCDFSQIGVGAGVSQAGRNYYTQVFSCGISETCGCSSAPSSPAASGMSAATAKGHAHAGSASHQRPTGAHDPASKCDWVGGKWICGGDVHSRHADPYNIKDPYHM